MAPMQLNMLASLLIATSLLTSTSLARPGSGAGDAAITPPSVPSVTPTPTVSTVLEGDTAIANQFIEGLNLTDFTIPQSRPSAPAPIKSASHQLRELTQTILSAQTAVSTAKAHAGVAVPMTAEELETEMAAMSAEVPRPVNVKKNSGIETSTSKDGITTWILLSGTDATSAPTQSQKVDKIAKAKATQAPGKTTKGTTPTTKGSQKAVEPTKNNNGNKNKPKVTPKPTTTSTETQSSDEEPTKKATTVKTPVLKKKTAATVQAEEGTTASQVPVKVKTTPTPFLVLEAKDAEFNLPEDRAAPTTSKPKAKRPAKSNANKKKIANKKKQPSSEVELLSEEEDTKNSTKTAVAKIKPKPMTTQLYNFLAREIMPTVGVGLLGLVVTASIAGYFLNPLGAIRRSYEAADRKEDLYYYNNEEYAGNGADGMSEEEVFGKVIAGMPSKGNTYRNAGVRYGNQLQSQRPSQFQKQHVQPKYAPAATVMSPNHGPYARYRNVQQVAPAPHQQQQYSASYNPHYQQSNSVVNPVVISQKSISSQIYALETQDTVTPSTVAAASAAQTTTEEVAVVTNTDSFSPSSGESSPSIVYSQSQQSYDADFMDNEANPNELKRRTQFVVGTVINTDDVPSTKVSVDEESKVDTNYPSIVMPEHGPRRRRRQAEDSSTASTTTTTTDNSDISSSSTTTESPTTTTTTPAPALPFDVQLNAAELDYAHLRKRFDTNRPSGKLAIPIMKEMKRLDYQMTRLRRVASEAKDIEQFQSEMHLEARNTELCEMLAQGLTQVTSDVRFVAAMLDEPKMAAAKLNERAQLNKRIEVKFAVRLGAENPSIKNDNKDLAAEQNDVNDKTDMSTESTIEYTTTPQPSLFLGFLKMLELKSAFGVNVLRSIRPAFDRAVQDVFHVNQTAYNH